MSFNFPQKVGGTKTSLNKQNNMKIFVTAFFCHNFRIEFIITKVEFLFAAMDKVTF